MPIPKPYAKPVCGRCDNAKPLDCYEPCDNCYRSATQGIDIEQEIMAMLAQEVQTEIDKGVLVNIRPLRIKKNYE